ncbi:MAG: N-acetylmuramoyl-L-alanine amidase [Lachnospiraceae bacterium]|nr:N-acetylmuramoyl-L-alanine amidase [Lachnospiraceae bacterium]
MTQLWKWTAVIGSVFYLLCMSVVIVYAANKSVVIVENDTQAEEGMEYLAGTEMEFTGAQENVLRYTFGNGVAQEDVSIEYRLGAGELVLQVTGLRDEWLLPEEVAAAEGQVESLVRRDTEEGLEIAAKLDRYYEFESSWDEHTLELTLTRPEDRYAFIVVVNPAHGGTNIGNAVNSLREKEITMVIGAALEKRLQDTGIKVLLTRTKDEDISTEARLEFLEDITPDLVVEIHVNADAVNEKTFGTEVYYNHIFYTRGMTNAEFADLMEREVVTAISGRAGGIFPDEEARYALVQNAKVPAVGIEVGYLTNEAEGALLQRNDYCEKIAEGIGNGLEKAREILDKDEE